MFTKILVPLDGSSIAEQAIPVAVSLARAARASLDFLGVHQPLAVQVTNLLEELEHARWHEDNRYITSIADETRATVDVPVTEAVLSGEPAAVICKRALDEGANLVVMTSHGRTGFSRAWLGSVADGVVRRAAVPVLMLRIADAAPDREGVTPLLERILVPLDGSRAAEAVLEPARALAEAFGGTLVLLRVVQPVPMGTVPPMGFAGGTIVEDEEATHVVALEARREVEAIARGLADRGFASVERHVVVETGVARAILDFANRHRVDLIAMSTHGRGASRLVVGSIADKVLRGSALPVLLRRPVLMAAEKPLLDRGEVEQQLAGVASD
jgi:nucleotide-binding universal stress UspA family protein